MTKRKSEYGLDRQAHAGVRWLPIDAVAIRYDKSISTIERWGKLADLGFPQAMQIVEHGPRLYSESELDEFDRRRAEQPRAPTTSPGRVPPPPPRRRKIDLTAAYAGAADDIATAAADQDMPAQQGRLTRPQGAGPAAAHTRPAQ